MDCTKLHQDIEKLKEQYNSLSSMLKSATESGKGKVAISEQLKVATTAEDQILASYLSDFFKKNPELLRLDLGNLIECKDAYGYPARINSIAPLPDGTIMIGGDHGILYRATIDEKDELSLGDPIECKSTIHSIATLPDGTIMIGGSSGTLYRATIDENGELNLGNRIECENANGDPAYIYSIAPLSDGTIMIGGYDGTLYRATIGENGELDLGNCIKCKNVKGGLANIYSIAPLPDGTIMMGGGNIEGNDNSVLYRATIGENGELGLGNCIKCKDAYGHYVRINSIAPLPDGTIMIGGGYGVLYRATIDKDGELNLGNCMECRNAYGYCAPINSITPLPDGTIMIGGGDVMGINNVLYRATIGENGELDLGSCVECKNADGHHENITSITPLPDGTIMIGGYGGILYRATLPQPTLSILKQKIDTIINKG